MPRIWLVHRFTCWDVIVGLVEWNERFGIRFMRLSSEMFPFASHAELGYSVEFAKSELSAVGRIAMKYGHRLTMHPVFVSTAEVDVGSIHTDCVA
jgi:UV DNA damage repair endonuclease